MVKDARSINPFGLRMPPELREQLEASARENGVSLNTEIVQRLTRSLSATLTTNPHYDLTPRVERLEQIVAKYSPKRRAR